LASIERVTVVFPEPMADQIRAAVEAGEYASTSEAVRDAVRLWTYNRKLRSEEVKMLRKAWDEGKRSGIAGRFDMRAIIREAKAEKRKAAGKRSG
jgi:antitoxin ParD1/3/4